jgi:hypothetical protein
MRQMSGKKRIMTSSIQELPAQARSQIHNLTVDEFARELEADTVTLIDIREPDQAGPTGAIPGAIQTGALMDSCSAAQRVAAGWL